MRTHVWRKSFTRLSLRHQRLPVQRRHFHVTHRQLDAIPPPSDPERSDAADKESIRKQHQESAPAEDNKARRSSLRRSRLYSKQPREVPTFTVPPWFLKHNVRLQEATTTRSKSDNATPRSLNLVDRSTGHIVLTLPFLDTPNHDGQPTTPNKLANFFSPKDVNVGKEIDQFSKDPTDSTTDAKRAAKQLSPSPANISPEPSLLMFLQLQLLLNAAFDITGPAAAKIPKPNIQLQTPDPFAHDDLDRFVENLADLTHADLIRLDANDVAELAADYLDNGEHAPGSISALPYDVYKDAGAARSMDIEWW